MKSRRICFTQTRLGDKNLFLWQLGSYNSANVLGFTGKHEGLFLTIQIYQIQFQLLIQEEQNFGAVYPPKMQQNFVFNKSSKK